MDASFTYIVPVQADASSTERLWAWRFTVIARAAGKCQECGSEGRLDACHLIPKRKRPDLRFDPDNGIAMCRSCHMSHDHKRGHRPSGRPVGYRMPHEFRERMREVGLRRAQEPGFAEGRRQSALDRWDRDGRKPLRPCDNCGAMLTRRQVSGNARFCSSSCHYAFRTGKARSGY